MKLGTANGIFEKIESPEFSVEEKGEAIHEVVNMETHNGVTKDSMLKVIRWLWHRAFMIDNPPEHFGRMEAIFTEATILPDCEHPNRYYLCYGDVRYIYEDGKYCGWYKPGEEEEM